MKLTVESSVKDGKLERNRAHLAGAIAHFEGKTITLTIERVRNKRTTFQNRWYWGVAVELLHEHLRQLGNTMNKSDVHSIIKLAVAKRERGLMIDEVVNKETGEVLAHRVKSTSELTTTEFMAFKEVLQAWSAEVFDLYIPDPDEQMTLID